MVCLRRLHALWEACFTESANRQVKEFPANVISNIHIANYKSIIDLPLELGRVNVFIGENGAGKSNILEAIALAGAAAANKLDNEFLASRGIRVVRPVDVRPAFAGRDPKIAIEVTASATNSGNIGYSIENDNQTYAKWRATALPNKSLEGADLFETLKTAVTSIGPKSREIVKEESVNTDNETDDLQISLRDLKQVIDSIREQVVPILNEAKHGKFEEPRSIQLTRSQGEVLSKALLTTQDRQTQFELSKFVTYSPENSVLRAPHAEGQIEPLGVKGEGVSKLFSFYVNQANGGGDINVEAAQHAQSILDSLDRSLRLLGWFDGVRLGREKQEDILEVRDYYIEEEDRHFELASANEGFFFLLFYFLLFSSDLTPPFFAIDNVDTSLNPALCRALTTELVNLATKHNKQAILTTHNPAILDGLNLDDDEQRLFVVSRNMDGETRVERIKKPNSFEGLPNLKMSEAFMRGLIGGLSTKF
jgi:predicted ATPase